MLLANMNWMDVLCEKLAEVKDCVIIGKKLLWGQPTWRGGMGGLCEICLTYLNCGFVVGKYELAGYVV